MAVRDPTRTVLGIRRNLSVEVVSDILGWVAVPVLKYRFHKQVDSLHQEVELAGQVALQLRPDRAEVGPEIPNCWRIWWANNNWLSWSGQSPCPERRRRIPISTDSATDA
jgi:hypothetical protein